MHLERESPMDEKQSPFQNTISPELLRVHQLDPHRIAIHHKRIIQAIHKQINTTIPVMGACTTSNGGVLSWKLITRLLSSTYHPALRKFQKSSLNYWRENFLITCIPAAGAASRFFSDLHKFALNFESQIPDLKNAFDSIFEKSRILNVSFEKRKYIQEILVNLRISPELSSLYDNLCEHDCENIKEQCTSFYNYLNQTLKTGKATYHFSEYKKNKIKNSTSHSNFLRTPWDYGSINFKVKNKKSAKETNFSNKNTHWMERISPQYVNNKKDPINSNDHLVFIGNHEENILKAYTACRVILYKYGSLPKALVPTTLEGDSFLMLKIAEQIKLLPCHGNVLVVPTNMKKEFEEKINDLSPILQDSTNDIFSLRNTPFAPKWLKSNNNINGKWVFFEQGCDLSTIRFNMDGSPFQDEKGNYAPVSAGHGELIHLFDKMADEFPNAECLHIRNVDNVIGTSNDRSEELNIPAESFRIIRDCIEYLRSKLEDFLFDEKAKKSNSRLHDETTFKILSYLGNFIDHNLSEEGLQICFDSNNRLIGIPYQSFHKIIGNLFHWQQLSPSLSDLECWEQTLSWLELPVSVFGVVRKEVADVGGGPIFAELPDGTKIKLCIEMPHASEEDAIEYFGSRGKATHFNPVLAFFELRTHKRSFDKEASVGKKVNYSKLFDERFWLLTKREYKGKPVCYHETVLHELIGNSATTNLIFIEVPRTLFRPHKSYFDSLGNDRRSYGFDETLATTETRNF
ncbi:DUF4301 family protein [Silvanigrella aquatica]|uniref:DUF4301 domain-containing protein n=1 Tax=Silvanigrella aquatica TaxID=1915309 RepID=A0A1L4D0W8_9BACT|nr:DUF4301 family protein [Silvanigrella aquatica]APJ03841.1 hypothetical protein AXG55_07955 [Silvanigrella aquatica]